MIYFSYLAYIRGIAATENLKVEFWGWTNFGTPQNCGGCGSLKYKFLDKVGPFVFNDYAWATRGPVGELNCIKRPRWISCFFWIR